MDPDTRGPVREIEWHDSMKERTKTYAGKTLHLDRREDGTIVLTAVAIIPESQLWTLEEPHRSAIAKGMAWAARTPPSETLHPDHDSAYRA